MTTTSLLNKYAANPVQNEFYRFLGKYLLGMGAVGAGIRGATGLGDLIGSSMTPQPTAPEPTVINVPYRAPSPTTEDERKRSQVVKSAAGAWDDAMNSWFMGRDAKSPWDIPAAYPAVGLGGIASLYGGNALMDTLLNKRKKTMQQQELDDAKSDYEKALLSQFKPIQHEKVVPTKLKEPTMAKLGGAIDSDTIEVLLGKQAAQDPALASLADKLDQLADQVLAQDKQAAGEPWSGLDYVNPFNYLPDMAHPANIHVGGAPASLGTLAAGGYATVAPLLALGSGLAVYNYAKANDPDKDKIKALQDQYEERWSKRPADIFARLVPVDEQGNATTTPTGPRPEDQTPAKQFKALGKQSPSTRLRGSIKSSSAEDPEIAHQADLFVRELFGA